MSRVVVNKPQPLEARFVEERDQLQVVFGARLRELRTSHNLTLEMLAERADLHANYVGAVERGERNLTLFNIWRIAGALGLPTTDLVNGLPIRKVKHPGTS
jgi:transcriptional regulator with XRE-family HTH domain